MSVQAIFFDLDNTLADEGASMQQALARVCLDLGPCLPAGALRELPSAFLRLSEAYWSTQKWVRGDIDEVRLELWRQALAFCDCGGVEIALQARDAYVRHRAAACVLYQETREVLQALSARFTLAVVTNGDGDLQRERLRRAGLERHFQLVVASTDVNAGKPDPAIFRFALDRLCLPAASVWHVGDRLDADVAGTRSAGLTAVWINRSGLILSDAVSNPHHEVASLTELLRLLEP